MRARFFVQTSVKCVALIALTLPGGGCHLSSPSVSAPSARVDTLWYATSRLRQSERLAFRFADSLEFGYYRISSKTKADLMRGGLDMRVIDSTVVTRAEFLQSVSAPSKDSNDVVVLSVHGYATSHTKAIRDAGEQYLRSRTKGRWVAFSWPSNGHGLNLLTQPGHMFMTGAYRADSAVAVKSKPAFAGLLLALHNAVGGQRLVLTAHSLGAQLAAETLAGDSTVRSALARDPVRAIGFFEPDIATQRFDSYIVPQIRALTKRLVLYASRNDNMLRFSTWVNRNDRAGLLPSDSLPVAGVEMIDVTNGITSEDWIRRHFGTHHAMKRETSALRDFFDIVVARKPANCRVKAGSAEASADGVWTLLPKLGDLSRCQ
ncbi:MAG: alpha/beta hydrolase [Gemmatimonadaceae bacterium]